MQFIKKVTIKGFKKFTSVEIPLNKNMNILIGGNEAGKTTVLEAIEVTINQLYKNADKSILAEMLNIGMVKAFQSAPSLQNLPRIYIELSFSLNGKEKDAEYFWGEHNLSKKEDYGISFECKFDEAIGIGLENEILAGKIPYEYYTMRWTAFSGLPYSSIKKPFGFISIDTSRNRASDSFNYFNRSLFSSKYDPATRMSAKNTFRHNLRKAFDDIKLDDIDATRKFSINEKKVVLETILSVLEDDIPLENKGSGMESLIKAQIALDKRSSRLDVILFEEPENHLCSDNLRKMLAEISKQTDAQMIISTHNNLITSSLNLKNVIWLNCDYANSLQGVDDAEAAFFVKAENNNLLQLLLSERVLLVEGATEYLLLPIIYKQLFGHSIEEDKITVIACNGISYKHYLEIAITAEKRVAVITDNDKKQSRIDEASRYNAKHAFQNVFMPSCTEDWTWEVCLYHLNKDFFDNLIKIEKNADYKYHGEEVESKQLGKMLNTKVDTAYQIANCNNVLNIPQHIKDALVWIKQ